MSLSKESRTEVGFLLQRFALPLCQDGWKKKKKKLLPCGPGLLASLLTPLRGWREVCSEMLWDSRSKEADGCQS